MTHIRKAAVLVACMLIAIFSSPAHAQATRPLKANPAADDFFTRGLIPEIRINLTDAQIKTLTDQPREYVETSMKENPNTTYDNVKVKLKGSVGSFRPINDRPALTLKMGKKGDRFHGLDKFHLNNSVQDNLYMNELLCSQIALEAGLPVSRTTHARVWINNRDLGLYVLKEGWDEHLLARFFADAKGNLYDAKHTQDIDFALDRDEGPGPDDKKDLAALVEACREPNKEKRYKLIEERLDINEFLTFTAMEKMLAHWDGYTDKCNNYRIYFRPDDKRAVFILHGMDQMFRDKGVALFNFSDRIVTKAVFENPVWQEKYRARVKELMPLFDPARLNTKLAANYQRVRAALAKINANEANLFDERMKEFKDVVLTRQKFLLEQMPPPPVVFDKNNAFLITAWQSANSGGVKYENARGILGFTCNANGPRVEAFYRCRVRLAKGKYVFEAKVRTTGVATVNDNNNQGAGVRLEDMQKRDNKVVGTSAGWELVSFPFEVTNERDVTLLLELRATAGSAAFDTASTIIRRVTTPAPATAPK